MKNQTFANLFEKPNPDLTATVQNLKSVMFSSTSNHLNVPKSAMGNVRDSTESHQTMSTMPGTASLHTDGALRQSQESA
jgi:hypothetical protein